MRAAALAAFVILAGCKDSPKPAPAPIASVETHAAPAKPVRANVDGHAFPDHVIALTWDDGPDKHTLDLARFLKEQHVSATFFVVGEWIDGTSSDPGEGDGVYETGHAKMHVLGDLVALGHRVANHTMHHVLLGDAPPDVVRRELGDAQRAIDPFVNGRLRMFRAPGGYWTESASHAIDDEPLLADAVGPIRWDVDRKDWEESTKKTPAAVVAARYLDSIESAGHGIVLLHDRVGRVGSTYALDLARALVPKLVAKGYVFAPPVLRFGPVVRRDDLHLPPSDVLLGDLNGDGRPDKCWREKDKVLCALGLGEAEKAGVQFLGPSVWREGVPNVPLALRDVDGDGRADLCELEERGTSCALAP